MKMQRTLAVVQRHLERTSSSCEWEKTIKDPRKAQGRRWTFGSLMSGLWAGAVTAMRNLRAVEGLLERAGDRISDTTLWSFLVRLAPGGFARLLVREVKQAHRAKEMKSDLPFSVVAVDGKTIWVGKHKAHRNCQLQHEAERPRYVMRMLRAVFVGGPCKLCLGQMPIAAKTNDMGAFPKFFKRLLKDYGRTGLLEVLTLDAGFASKKNADLINAAGRGYVIALKGNEKDLLDEAERLLGTRTKPHAETAWEKYNGFRIRRLLFRTTEMAAWNGWSHLRQVWRVRQETERDGKLTVEERYFVTNLTQGKTAGRVPLKIVRAHWGIENDCNWTLDTQWAEDDCPWASAALEVVSLMRLLAYNVMMRLRTRRLRSEGNRKRSWATLLNWITDLLVAKGVRRILAPTPQIEAFVVAP
jgi:Transposase DDE domain